MPTPERRAATTTTLDGLRRVVRALRLAAGNTESATGLSAAQLFVLRAVHAHPESSLTTVAARTLTDRTSVREVVDRLVARGLVECRASAVDRRSVALMTTPAAAAVLARAPHPPTRRLLDGLDAIPERDLRALAGGGEALVRAMALDGEPATMLFEEPPPAPAPPSARVATPAPAGRGRARSAPRPRAR